MSSEILTMPTQTLWRWCQKCQGMFFSGHPDQGNCPSGGKHDGSASAKYLMEFGEGDSNTNPQGGWRFCRKCQGLFFHNLVPGEDIGAGVFSDCPAGGIHDGSMGFESGSSGHYMMEIGEGNGSTNPQGGWRFCSKCHGLFFSENPDHGKCPSGGKHDGSKSANYIMHEEQDIQDFPESITLNPGPITTGLSLGGFASLTMHSNGNFIFSGHMHNSGLIDIDFLLTFVAITPSGIAITIQHGDSTGGTLSTKSRDADWTLPTGILGGLVDISNNQKIRDNWAEVSQANLTTTIHANDTLSGQIEKALDEALQQALAAAGKAAVQGLISLL
jgi:hypothetical protein